MNEPPARALTREFGEHQRARREASVSARQTRAGGTFTSMRCAYPLARSAMPLLCHRAMLRVSKECMGKRMELVYFVTVLALIQYFLFGIAVGQARRTYNVPAPAMSGPPEFERVQRVQMNTLEQLVMFIPSLWMFAHLVSTTWAAGLGLVFIVGRALYSSGYRKAANKRGLGFGVSSLPVLIMMVGSLIGSGVAAWRAAGIGG